MPVRVIELAEFDNNQNLISEWKKLSYDNKSLFGMYGSIEWIKTVSNFDHDIKIFLSIDKSGRLLSVIPVKSRISSIEIISCQPVGLIDVDCFLEVFSKIFDIYKDKSVIYIKSVDYKSIFFETIWNSSKKSKTYFAHCDGSSRLFYELRLDSTFEDYLNKFTRKERYNLNRQYRLASEAVGGDLKAVRIVSPDQIDFFMQAAEDVFLNSWKPERTADGELFSAEFRLKYNSLAEEGLLRSYILVAGGDPWAYVIGYQWNGIYHYANISYKNDVAKYSPGIVLFYLMLKDLFSHNKPSVLNFGIGDSSYKRRFSNYSKYDCSVLIIKRNIFNIVKYYFINIFNYSKTYIKLCLERYDFLKKIRHIREK